MNAMRGKTPLIAALLILALFLAFLSTGFQSSGNRMGFFAVLLAGAGLILLVLRLLALEPIPGWLSRLTFGAAILRLLAGTLWFTLLPVYGYDTPVQQAGYIMEDAYPRDSAAWELAGSGRPLASAFSQYRGVDQYGGLLFLSAGVYRLVGESSHTPLLIVILTASISALAVPITWAFTRRFWDDQTAALAAWGLALYPEAVLLGSSQMREAFMVTFAAAGFFGLAVFLRTQERRGAAWLAGAVTFSLPLSPPLAAILVGLLALLAAGLGHLSFLRNKRFWAILLGLAILVVGGLWLGWKGIAPRLSLEQFSNPLALLAHWAETSARWQRQLTENASGWVQRVFAATPEWSHTPILLAYGVSLPLLPAQLIAWSVPLWWGIGVWRAVGWTILLPLLVYAPLRILRESRNRGLMLAVGLAAWLTVLIASYWGGGDLWDNPRYRVSFSALQIGLAAWTVTAQLRRPDPWMRRALVSAGLILAWFVPWYLRRYTAFDLIFGWTVIDVFKLLGLGVASAALYIVWDWVGKRKTV